MTDHEAVGPSGPAASVRPRPTVGAALLVAVGAGLGSLGRHLLESSVDDRWASLWVINPVGSLLLGFLVGVLSEPAPPPPPAVTSPVGRTSTTGSPDAEAEFVRTGRWWLSPLFGTGLLGGFTTFSTVAVESWGTVWGVAQLLIMTVACVVACALGHRLGRRLSR